MKPMARFTTDQLFKRMLWLSTSCLEDATERQCADEINYYEGQRDMVLDMAKELMETEEFNRFSGQSMPDEMTLVQWRQHIKAIKHYSVENKLDYASAWGEGHTVFACKGKLFLRPSGSRTINPEEMSEKEVEVLLETPGTPFMVVQAL